MTGVVARRLFDDEGFDDDSLEESRRTSKTAEELRELGLIRASCIIRIELNETIKKMARCQGKNADEVMGEFVESNSEIVMRWKAQQRAKELLREFGKDWIDILRNVDLGPLAE